MSTAGYGRRGTLLSTVAAAVLILSVTAAGAQQGGSLAGPDREFVREAARGGLAEVELGKLAQKRASSDAVREFGQRMVTDHGKANGELAQLAEAKGVRLPEQLDDKHRELRERLGKVSGAEFDRLYMTEMVQDHRKDVAKFKQQAEQGKDPQLKAWAAKKLPTLQEHLRIAQGLQARVKGAAKPGS